ncbi:hypothetical protein [Micromonospora carbonacea]|uniref:Uncharacterized protein n=1 Tax=Micromonospora carbonacea TaxID=47853 RepID=A0A1C5AAS1_9ACTN|nr:hypothetical protein [Micromonospora carbonacea]SCF42295.1 hypothetical protein GA0070563_11262 [Micromonospora carbonacea]
MNVTFTADDDTRVTVTTDRRTFRGLDRERLELAWLLWLEISNPVALAADALHRANITL